MVDTPAKTQPVVFVVDDDEELRAALSSLIRSIGLQVELFASAAEFRAQLETFLADRIVAARRNAPGTRDIH